MVKEGYKKAEPVRFLLVVLLHKGISMLNYLGMAVGSVGSDNAGVRLQEQGSRLG